MIAPARRAVFQVLSAVASGTDLPAAIAATRHTLTDPRDRALAAEIATGVERLRAALDHLISTLSRRSIDRLDPEVATILRLSAYQILHLTRVPVSAVVHDAVDLTRLAGKSSAAGFVNAVLRSLSRQRHRLPLPPRPTDDAARDAMLDYLSVTLSHPRWLASRWLDRLGFAITEQWMQFNNAPAPLTLRANRQINDRDGLAERLAARGVVTTPGRFAPDALIVERGQPLESEGLDAGWFVVQDEASQLVALLAGPEPGSVILDTCASPGNKATAIAASARSARVVACDVRHRRITLLSQTVSRTRVPNVTLAQADLARGLPFRDVFDTVIVDAPCSGLGTLRRDPDIRWRRRDADLALLAEAERQMLRQAATAVRLGGRLIYATCSSEPEENDEVASGFLDDAPGYIHLDAHDIHPDLPHDVVDAHGFLRTSPDRHGLEVFFGAVFKRTS